MLYVTLVCGRWPRATLSYAFSCCSCVRDLLLATPCVGGPLVSVSSDLGAVPAAETLNRRYGVMGFAILGLPTWKSGEQRQLRGRCLRRGVSVGPSSPS